MKLMIFLLFAAEGLEFGGEVGEEGVIVRDETWVSGYKIDYDWSCG